MSPVTAGQHTDKGEGVRKNKNIEKLDCHYILDLEGSLKKSTTLPGYQRYFASPIYDLCDLAKLMTQCLGSLICRMGMILVPTGML